MLNNRERATQIASAAATILGLAHVPVIGFQVEQDGKGATILLRNPDFKAEPPAEPAADMKE